MSPCIYCHDVVSRPCSFRSSMSCQEHFGGIDGDSGSCWSCTGLDETSASVSLSWNEFQSFELAARTHESSIWSLWENTRSIWSPRLRPLSDLMMPTSIFDVASSSIYDDDADLPKVFTPNHKHFMGPIGIEAELSTEIASDRSPMPRLQLETHGIGSGRPLEQTPSNFSAKATNQVQFPLTSAITGRHELPVVEVSRSKEDNINSDPNSIMSLHKNAELPMYFSSSSNQLSTPLIVQDEPPLVLSQLFDSYALHEDVVALEDRVNNPKPPELAPYFQSSECAHMRCSLIPAMPQSLLAEISFKHQREPLVPFAVFDAAPQNTIYSPADGAMELPLALNCDLPNSTVSTLSRCIDSDLAGETTEEAVSSIESSYCSKIVSSWNESLSAIMNPALSAGVPSTSKVARNFGLVDRKTYSCVIKDETQTLKNFPREAVSSQGLRSYSNQTDRKCSNKPVHRRRVAMPGSLPMQVYRYYARPNHLNLPLHRLDNLFYLDIAIEEDAYFRYLGRIVIKTIPEVAPRMSENFAILCERRVQSYRGCSVFQCWVGQSILTGDTSGKHGRGGQDAYGGNFLPDQNDLRPFLGAVAMRRYRKGFSCQGHVGSQFRIFLTKHLNMGGIFGMVVSGLDVAYTLGNLGDRGGRPTRNAVIAECGRLDTE